MKTHLSFFIIIVLMATLLSCSDDEEKVKGDPDLTHEGVKWNIQSAEYTLIDQNTSGSGIGQTYKSGTKANAGTFYFVEGEGRGSFEMDIEGYNKEDAFSYSNNNGAFSIVEIDQNVGIQTNQNVLWFDGTSTTTEIAIDGEIIKQSTSGNFVLTVSLTLVKQ